MMNKVSKRYFLYTLFLLAKQQVARPEPNVLFFLPNILFCNSYHFALAIILPKCTYHSQKSLVRISIHNQ